MTEDEALLGEILALQGSNHFEKIIANYDKLLERYPHLSSIHYNRGIALWSLGRFEEAMQSQARAIDCDKQNADAHNERGKALYALGREAEALLDFEQSLAINPHHLPARKNRVVIFQNTQKHEEALVDFEHLIQLNYEDADLHYNYGLVLLHLNRFKEAVAEFERAKEINPSQANVVFNEMHCRLAMGDLSKGWPLFERRWESSSMKGALRHYSQPLWLGQAPLKGITILLWPEQGLGDVFQFCRYVCLVESKGAKVLLSVGQSFLRLFTQSFANTGVTVMLDGTASGESFDFHCPLMSLPFACGTNIVAKIPAPIPYLFAELTDVKSWRIKLETNHIKSAQRIGLCWASSVRPDLPKDRDRRSLHLSKVKPLAEMLRERNIQLISLQMEQPASQLKELESQNWQGPPIIDLTADLKDWADTAALIANLDLVITCCTAVAHLAAAMGKPTWILLHDEACWRWLENRDDSPWYPTVRLFRQKQRGDWDGVMAEVALALASYNA